MPKGQCTPSTPRTPTTNDDSSNNDSNSKDSNSKDSNSGRDDQENSNAGELDASNSNDNAAVAAAGPAPLALACDECHQWMAPEDMVYTTFGSAAHDPKAPRLDV